MTAQTSHKLRNQQQLQRQLQESCSRIQSKGNPQQLHRWVHSNAMVQPTCKLLKQSRHVQLQVHFKLGGTSLIHLLNTTQEGPSQLQPLAPSR